MTDEIEIAMMTQDFSLWRCLHDGPLSKETIGLTAPGAQATWARFEARNMALIAKLSRAYGAAAVLAWRGDLVVGMLRFYPKAVWEMEGAGVLCLGQEFPAGARDDFPELDFPPRGRLEDQVLKVHCLMVVSSGDSGESYRRKGIATRLVRKLVEWAGREGWKGIEAETFEDLPLIYDVTGDAGRTFWEKLGFRVADRFPHPHLQDSSEFVAKLEEQAAQAGMDQEKAKDSIIMRLDLD